jgi:hypothetical protein
VARNERSRTDARHGMRAQTYFRSSWPRCYGRARIAHSHFTRQVEPTSARGAPMSEWPSRHPGSSSLGAGWGSVHPIGLSGRGAVSASVGSRSVSSNQSTATQCGTADVPVEHDPCVRLLCQIPHKCDRRRYANLDFLALLAFFVVRNPVGRSSSISARYRPWNRWPRHRQRRPTQIA